MPAARARTSASCRGSTGSTCPPGFCITTDAFQRVVSAALTLDDQLDRLSRLRPDDQPAIDALSAEVRRTIQAVDIPDDLTAAITSALARLGDDAACAVRSSATAEDLPTASFAGQHDTYLNVVGPAAVLEHVRRCWASLFTERAVTYRLRNGVDHRTVRMAVVVQRMVVRAGGRRPVHRRPGDVEPEGLRPSRPSFGLGEALVSGLVNADVYQVRDGVVVAGDRHQAARHPRRPSAARAAGHRAGAQEEPALTDAQVLRLARLGRRIEAHFGRPQDIEWCLADDELCDRPEPADHHAVPVPVAARRRQPRLHLRRPPADDDRRR